MSISITIPTILRPLTNGEKKVQAQGETVADIIQFLDTQYPGIGERLVKDGQVHRFVNIYVNENDIRFSDGLETRTQTGDSLTVLPAVAGG